MVHTETELSQAVQSMFRVRGVESPPEPSGERTIWHRGAKGADLVTWVDTLGKVTRQELYLFEDCLVWEKGAGIKTGEHQEVLGSKLAPAPGMIAFDQLPDGERLKRARTGLEAYAGDDKCIVHVRSLVHQATRSSEDDGRPVTRPQKVIEAEDRAKAAAELKGPGRRLSILVALVGAVLAAWGAWLILK